MVVSEWTQATTGGTQTVLVGFLRRIRVRIRALAKKVIDHGGATAAATAEAAAPAGKQQKGKRGVVVDDVNRARSS